MLEIRQGPSTMVDTGLPPQVGRNNDSSDEPGEATIGGFSSELDQHLEIDQ